MNDGSEARRVASLRFYAAVLLVGVLAYRIVEPFLTEIGWAVVPAICVAPLQRSLSRRFGPIRSAACLTLLVLFVLVVPLLLVARTVAGEGLELVSYVKAHRADRGGPMELLHRAWQWLHDRTARLGLRSAPKG